MLSAYHPWRISDNVQICLLGAKQGPVGVMAVLVAFEGSKVSGVDEFMALFSGRTQLEDCNSFGVFVYVRTFQGSGPSSQHKREE